MIWQLMKHDQAWKFLPRVAAGSALACLLGHLSAVPLLLVAVPFFSLFPATACQLQHRDVYFQASLPIAPKKIYLSRAFPMLALLWLPVAIGAVFGLADGHPGFTVTLLDFGSLFFVAIMAVQSVAIQCKLTQTRANAFSLFWLAGWGVCGISALSGLPAGLLRQGLLATVACPAICWLSVAAIVRGTWRALPESFDFAPGALLPPDVRQSSALNDRLPFARWRLVFANILSSHPAWLLQFVIIGMSPASKWPYAMGATLWGILGLVWVSTRAKTRWLAALPVPPGRLLACILVPALLAVSAGYELGLRIPAIADTMERGVLVTSSADTEIADTSQDCKMFNVLPPNEYLVRAKEDNAPIIRAPWGETFDPATNWVDGFDVYNPYSSGCNNSERFLDWQFARATAAVYGHSIPRDHSAGSYVVVSPLAIPRPRKQLATIAVTFFGLTLMMLLVILEDWYRLHHMGRRLRRLLCILATLPFMVLFGRVNEVGQWLSWALPANPFAAIAVALLPLALIYWVLETIFRQLEFIDKPAIIKRR